jgi:3-oxoacyl-[acyl-carrier-protein] synthase II
MLLKRRVVITGLGAITPLGVGVEESWRSLCQGKSGVGAITSFDASSFRTRVAGEVKGFKPLDFIDRKLVRRGDGWDGHGGHREHREEPRTAG